MTGEWS